MTDKPKSAGSIPRVQSGDMWGGLAATAVILPQAMAFGVALFAPVGIEASHGAIAGLLGAAIACTLSGMFGGTYGLISSPTGPVLVLMGGALAALTNTGLGGAALVLNLAAVIMFTGVFQIFIGLSGGGKLIKYIPYPVVSGFLTGSAILMIHSQIAPLSGSGVDASWASWRWLPLCVAIITMISTHFGPKLLRWLPGTIAGLLAGTLAFHLIAAFNPAAIPEQWLIGRLPDLGSIGAGLSLHTLNELHLLVVIPAALALAILASLDTLLTAVIADVNTGLRHNANRELVGQGFGQILSGFLGGTAAAGTTGATVVAVKSGGRRWAGVFAGITFVVLILLAGDVGRYLPISVLAGIILSVSLHLFDLDIITWLKQRRNRQDAFIAILVTIVTVSYDLMVAVGLGVLIAIILFIRTQIRASIVHRRSTAAQVHSLHARNAGERELLDKHGDRIILYELRGNLFFATADSLLEELSADLEQPNWIILAMRRVLQIDLTAIKLIQQIASRLQNHGGKLIFCDVHKGIGIGKKVKKALQKASLSNVHLQIRTFNGKDEALEFAENALLRELDLKPAESSDEVQLKDNDLCHALAADELDNLANVITTRELKSGHRLFRKGDSGDEIFMVASGQIDIRLPTTKHHYKRLATCRPGSFFGELALLKPGPRVADAVAVHDTKLYVLNRDGLDSLGKAFPGTAINLLTTLAKIQVNYLRWSTAELQHLSEW